MTTYFTKDNDGNITVSANFSFPDSIATDKNIVRCHDGKLYFEGEEPQLTEQTLEEVKVVKLSEVNAVCDNILKNSFKTYPDIEVMTFEQQIREAHAYRENGESSDVPLLSALAKARGIMLSDLVGRVIEKHDDYSSVRGALIGQRQALEDRLGQCKTIEEMAGIELVISIPENRD